jgi:hypothetical protein
MIELLSGGNELLLSALLLDESVLLASFGLLSVL